MIDHYSFGTINIDGQRYSSDVIVAGSKVRDWRRRTSHEVTVDDLAPILAENPKVIIFGTGESGVCQVFDDTISYLAQRGIKTVVLKTGEAVGEFNSRILEDGLVGAFHLTC